MKIVVHRVAAFLVCLLLASNAVAGLVPNADGTAYDNATGLLWKRCPEGQTWAGGATPCSGPTISPSDTWAEAKALNSNLAGYTDWRLPNIRELESIVDRAYALSVVDMTVFPSTMSY